MIEEDIMEYLDSLSTEDLFKLAEIFLETLSDEFIKDLFTAQEHRS